MPVRRARRAACPTRRGSQRQRDRDRPAFGALHERRGARVVKRDAELVRERTRARGVEAQRGRIDERTASGGDRFGQSDVERNAREQHQPHRIRHAPREAARERGERRAQHVRVVDDDTQRCVDVAQLVREGGAEPLGIGALRGERERQPPRIGAHAAHAREQRPRERIGFPRLRVVPRDVRRAVERGVRARRLAVSRGRLHHDQRGIAKRPRQRVGKHQRCASLWG